MTRYALPLAHALVLVSVALGAGCERNPEPKAAATSSPPAEAVEEARRFIAEDFTPRSVLERAGLLGEHAPADVAEFVEQELARASAKQRAVSDAPGSGASQCAVIEGPFEEPSRGFIELRLNNPGAEPRRALRYALQPGRCGRVALLYEFDLEPPDGRVTMPTIHIDLDYVVTSGASAGRFRVEFVATHLVVLPTWENDQVFYPLLLSRMKDFTFEMSVELDARGFVRGARYATSATASSGAAPFARELARTLENWFVPLPTEPVGVSAAWQVKAHRAFERTEHLSYVLTNLEPAGAGFLVRSWTRARALPLDQPWPEKAIELTRRVPAWRGGAVRVETSERGWLDVSLESANVALAQGGDVDHWGEDELVARTQLRTSTVQLEPPAECQ